MGPIILCVCNAGLEEATVSYFSCTVHVNCTVQRTVELAWTVYIATLFMWTVQENCIVHLKNSEQCNSLALREPFFCFF
jgi:hypothetical protein